MLDLVALSPSVLGVTVFVRGPESEKRWSMMCVFGGMK